MPISEGERLSLVVSGNHVASKAPFWTRPIVYFVVLVCGGAFALGIGVGMLVATGCKKEEDTCQACSAMASLIDHHSSDINAIASTTKTKQLMVEAALMLALWRVPVGNYVHHTRAIVGFSFGQGPMRESGKPAPGATNKALAWSIKQLLIEFESAGRPRPEIAVQWEIAEVLADTYGIRADVIASVDADGNYLSTFGVMQQIAPVLQAQQIQSITLVAHPDHAVRCGKVCVHFNISVLGTEFLAPDGTNMPWSQFGCDVNGYSADSLQLWTRSRNQYLMTEFWLRPKGVSSGQISFSNDNFNA